MTQIITWLFSYSSLDKAYSFKLLLDHSTAEISIIVLNSAYKALPISWWFESGVFKAVPSPMRPEI